MAMVIERVSVLLNRMVQADPLTLTNRLRRQNLKGADVSHISRSTISGIVNEVNGLRSQFRGLLEDDQMAISCTRKDLRALFKVFKDAFIELGEIRATLNDVILNPSSAHRVRELVMHPGKAESADRDAGTTAASSWMAPISKLFAGYSDSPPRSDGPSQAISANKAPSRRPPARVVPKVAAAPSASTTTVNVEFSGSGVGRSMTLHQPTAAPPQTAPQDSSSGAPRSVMNIFAGAPRPQEGDPWVVLPKARSPGDGQRSKLDQSETIGRSALRNATRDRRMSRQLDAMLDFQPRDHVGEEDYQPALLERTLRRRGLSDSSIHSTFMNHEDDASTTPLSGPSSRQQAPHPSVLQLLGRHMQSLRFATGSPTPTSPLGESSRSVSASAAVPAPPRMSSPSHRTMMPNMASLAATAEAMEIEGDHFVGSPPREDTLNRRIWAPPGRQALERSL